jgi:hypothetical protein
MSRTGHGAIAGQEIASADGRDQKIHAPRNAEKTAAILTDRLVKTRLHL